MKSHTDLTGIVFGLLTVTAYDHGSSKGAWWRCACACGRSVIALAAKLKAGKRKSCGCGPRGRPRGLAGTIRPYKTPEWIVWSGLRQRCENPANAAYRWYGGRGITVDPSWSVFAQFIEDMGPRPPGQTTIERIDNDGPYAPWNCRWASHKEQARNKRGNHKITIGDVTKCLVDWAAEYEIPARTISNRILRDGWDPERAVTEPAHPKSPRGEGQWSRLRPKPPKVAKPKPSKGPAGRPWRTVTIDGVTKSARQWADEVGIDYTAFRGRISHGWEPKWALEAPAGAPRARPQGGALSS